MIKKTLGYADSNNIMMVYDGDATIVTIEITPPSVFLYDEGQQQFTALATLTDTEVIDITNTALWSSSNIEVVNVSDSGLAKVVGIGNAVITATQDGVEGTASFTVETVSIIPGNITILADYAQANGEDINEVSVLVTDSQLNPAVGVSVYFTVDAGNIIPASALTDTNGVVTATLTNTQYGAVKVTATLPNNNNANIDVFFVLITGINIAGANFPSGEGAPRTGLKGGFFHLMINDAFNFNILYDWVTSHPTFVTVSPQGQVNLIEDVPRGIGEISVTGTLKSGLGYSSLVYTFEISKWFRSSLFQYTHDDAMLYCQSLGDGYTMTNYALVTNSVPDSGTGGDFPKLGFFFGEWGSAIPVFNPEFSAGIYWAIDGPEYVVSLLNGSVTNENTNTSTANALAVRDVFIKNKG